MSSLQLYFFMTAMKTYEGVEVQIHVFLISSVDDTERSGSPHLRGRAHFLEGGWAPESYLNAVEKNHLALPRRENSRPAHNFTDWAVPAPVTQSVHGLGYDWCLKHLSSIPCKGRRLRALPTDRTRQRNI
jgi:hypothetical protein